MKKLLPLFVFLAVTQFVFADSYPVLKVILKGGISGRVESVVTDLKNRPGAGSWCFDYVQQTLGNTDFENVEFGTTTKLDVTDYRISNELLEYAQQQISVNHLTGTYTREVADVVTGCKRVYMLTWNSKNKFGDKGNICVVKLDSPVCLQSMAS